MVFFYKREAKVNLNPFNCSKATACQTLIQHGLDMRSVNISCKLCNEYSRELITFITHCHARAHTKKHTYICLYRHMYIFEYIIFLSYATAWHTKQKILWPTFLYMFVCAFVCVGVANKNYSFPLLQQGDKLAQQFIFFGVVHTYIHTQTHTTPQKIKYTHTACGMQHFFAPLCAFVPQQQLANNIAATQKIKKTKKIHSSARQIMRQVRSCGSKSWRI